MFIEQNKLLCLNYLYGISRDDAKITFRTSDCVRHGPLSWIAHKYLAWLRLCHYTCEIVLVCHVPACSFSTPDSILTREW